MTGPLRQSWSVRITVVGAPAPIMSKVVPTQAASTADPDPKVVVSGLDLLGSARRVGSAAGSTEVFTEAVSREAEASVVAEVT